MTVSELKEKLEQTNSITFSLPKELSIPPSAFDKVSIEEEAFENPMDRLKRKDFSEEITARRRWNLIVSLLTLFWIASIPALLILCGTETIHLSDAVIITYLGATTTQVIGLPLILLKYLFKKESSQES